MSEEKNKRCDILLRLGTKANPVRPVRIMVMVLKEDETWSMLHSTAPKDMCPGAIKRAIGFVDRAASRPTQEQPTREAAT